MILRFKHHKINSKDYIIVEKKKDKSYDLSFFIKIVKYLFPNLIP